MQESGIDGGGLSRELMTLLQRQLLAPASGLFRATHKGELFPAYTDLTEELQQRYRFVGQVLGRLLLTGQLCEAPLAPFFLNVLLKNPSLLSDVRSRSEELYRSLLYLSHEASDAELAEYRMCVEYQNGVCAEYQNGASECQYGEEAVLKTYVFQENGENVVITHENVHLFVQYLAQFYLCDSILQPTMWIQTGMRDVLVTTDFSLFDAVALEVWGDA